MKQCFCWPGSSVKLGLMDFGSMKKCLCQNFAASIIYLANIIPGLTLDKSLIIKEGRPILTRIHHQIQIDLDWGYFNLKQLLGLENYRVMQILREKIVVSPLIYNLSSSVTTATQSTPLNQSSFCY